MRKAIPKKIRQQVYEKYDGHCAYCGIKLEMKDMQVDHIDPVYRAYYDHREVDESIDNYNPACRACNFYKSTYDLEAFRHNIEHMLIGKLRRDFNYKMLLKYGIIHEDFKPVRFYFEKRSERMKFVNWQYCNDLNDINEAIKTRDENWEGLTSANDIISIAYDTNHGCYVIFWRMERSE